MNRPQPKFDTNAAILHLQKCFQAGEIKISEVNSYTANGITHMPKPRHTFYRIYFQQGDTIVFNGCYEIQTELATELKQTPGKLEMYLCWQLAPRVVITM